MATGVEPIAEAFVRIRPDSDDVAAEIRLLGRLARDVADACDRYSQARTSARARRAIAAETSPGPG